MPFNIPKRKLKTLLIVMLLVAVAPLLLTVYRVITSNETSIVFLEGYPLVADVFIAYYVFLIILVISWLVLQFKSIMVLKNERKKNELLHLQSQVNPHFFFNMLNNLYGLMGADVERAKELVLKLSEMMRYSIYEGEKAKVTLNEEVDYLKNYIELHRMRYHKGININFNISMDDGDCLIMPLLLIILVENAFKHGVENLRSDAFVNITLQVNNGVVVFEIENKFDADQLPPKKGIGIKNLKRRLSLVYAGKHQLDFKSESSIYQARLTLEL